MSPEKSARQDGWKREKRLLEDLDAAIPLILESQRGDGKFGTLPWNCRDQNVILDLAAAWSLPESSYYRDARVLDAVAKGGLVLRETQDEEGEWAFLKKDNSEWGRVLMPWTYGKWILAYGIVGDELPENVRAGWIEGLELGYGQIARKRMGHKAHNFGAHYAMGLYCAGRLLERPEWREQARGFIRYTLQCQSNEGWWSEHHGPVVGYNFVYSESLGLYYAISGDKTVLPALEKAALFHSAYTYPDGSGVETVDERNPYTREIRPGNVGFSFTETGRAFLKRQHGLYMASGKRFSADYAAKMLLYGEEGQTAEPFPDRNMYRHQMGREAVVERSNPWLVSLSAYACEPPYNRWIQDRQNLLSLYHDSSGLIAGGGNTKLQPLWSTFTAGDTGVMRRQHGREEPDFHAYGGLIHVPQSGQVFVEGECVGMELFYGSLVCRVRVKLIGPQLAEIEYSAEGTAFCGLAAHLPLMPLMEKAVFMDGNRCFSLESAICNEKCSRIRHGAWEIELPRGACLSWPVLPHNPYRRDGRAEREEGLLAASFPVAPGGAPSRVVVRAGLAERLEEEAAD